MVKQKTFLIRYKGNFFKKTENKSHCSHRSCNPFSTMFQLTFQFFLTSRNYDLKLRSLFDLGGGVAHSNIFQLI